MKCRICGEMADDAGLHRCYVTNETVSVSSSPELFEWEQDAETSNSLSPLRDVARDAYVSSEADRYTLELLRNIMPVEVWSLFQ